MPPLLLIQKPVFDLLRAAAIYNTWLYICALNTPACLCLRKPPKSCTFPIGCCLPQETPPGPQWQPSSLHSGPCRRSHGVMQLLLFWQVHSQGEMVWNSCGFVLLYLSRRDCRNKKCSRNIKWEKIIWNLQDETSSH